MLPSSYGSEIAFFEIAATLIPLFLLAGVVVDRLRPEPDASPTKVAIYSVLVPLIGAWFILAEVAAIGALVTGSAALPVRLIVEGALAAGMIGVIASLSAPWLSRRVAGYPRPLRFKRLQTYAPLLVVFVGTVLIMDLAVTSQGSEERRNELIVEINGNSEAVTAVEDRVSNLVVELARSQRDFFTAMAHGQNCLVAFGHLQEEEKIRLLMNDERKTEYRLILTGSNLNRELDGRPPLARLPRDVFPVIRDPRRVRPPGKECREEIMRDGNVVERDSHDRHE